MLANHLIPRTFKSLLQRREQFCILAQFQTEQFRDNITRNVVAGWAKPAGDKNYFAARK